MGHVDAIWIGPSGYTLVNGTVLEHGVTVVSVPEVEATGSDNWLPVPDSDTDSED